ncbi:MAG TPA: tetratricopeptide repeat protein, partial [Planctomycetaceae bacterium]|nr:tetratricopeptide repeat protein [Planctomycetaceae bacterium]
MEALAAEPAKLVREGIEHHKQGRLNRAAALYEQALEIEPLEADARHLLGLIAHQRGDHAAAIDGIRRAIAINERNATYHSNLGVACRSLGKTTESLAAFRRALELNPTSPGMQFNLGNALKDASEFSAAAAEFRRVLAQEPTRAEAWSGLGDALRGMEEFAEARRCHERAIELAPRSADVHYNLGLMHRDEGQLSRAAECFLKAACLRPDFSDAHANLANTYEDLGHLPQALVAFDRALRLKPDAPLIQFNRSLALLRQGDLAQGWPAYEWRWRHNGKPRVFSEAEWTPALDPTATVLIYSEQGIGDEVMFASCFGEVISRSGRCLIECEPRLLKLFARSFPAATFFPRAGQIDPRTAGVPHWDSQIASGSLPRLLRPRLDAFPTHAGYLVPDSEKVRQWRDRFERLGVGLTVGIAWRGGKDPATRRRRSTTLAQWASLFRIPGVAFVNLQYGDCTAELEQTRRDFAANLHDWPDADPLSDLDNQAAQIAALDLVISVDNATVHLAGALNIPVWTLLPFASDWRWFTNASGSPWYPGMRLFRQETADGALDRKWNNVFATVARELEELANTRAAEDYRRGVRFQDAGQLAEAIDSFRRAAALRPDDSHMLNDLGAAWKQAGRFDLAEAAYRAALAADPHSTAVWFNLGNTHRESNRLEEAVTCYRRARETAPRDHRVLVNLAVALKDLHRFSEAVECLEEALADVPDLAAARFDRSLIWLAQGSFAAGWDEYEWRLESEPRGCCTTVAVDCNSFAGRPVRILAEQGIGDQVMFASCLEEIARAASACSVECDPRLVELFARSFPEIQVLATPSKPTAPQTTAQEQVDQRWDGRERRVSDADSDQVIQFIGSLPRIVRRQIEDFPARIGFLKPSPPRVASWRARLSR